MLSGLLLLAALFAADEDLTCLKQVGDAPAASTLLYTQLQQEAYAALDRRTRAF
jgi:hypothetical protein